jgi:CRISPR/Cas system-associated exonuclease Cas4 (RecB family)
MYALKFHRTTNLEKWSGYSRGQQVLMIANELNRAGNLMKKDMQTEVKNCYERAMELTDLTSADKKWKGHLRELRRFREVLAALYREESTNASHNERLYDALIKMEVEAYNMVG